MIITAPERIDETNRIAQLKPSLFLAGSISNAADWQSDAYRILGEKYTIFNPRRKFFDVSDQKVEEEQITWEHYYLERCQNILFYFAPETVAPITLFEYGCYLGEVHDYEDYKNGRTNGMIYTKNLFVGVHPGYPRKNDVIIQTGLRRPNQKVNIGFREVLTECLLHKF